MILGLPTRMAPVRASEVGARLEVFEGGCEELGLRLLLV